MASPFPGMDPDLEAHWRDVHAGLVIYARDALQGVLPAALRARVEESVPDPATETFLEIIDCESRNRVVTVIEFLSPSNNSPGPNRERYLRKQREVCSSDAYEGTLNYAADPEPALFGADKDWANAWLFEKVLRSGQKATRRSKKPKRRR